MINDLRINEIKTLLVTRDVYKIKKASDIIHGNSINPTLFLEELIPIYYLFSSHSFPWDISWGEEYTVGLDIRDQIANIFSDNISIELKQIIEANTNLFDLPEGELRNSILAYEKYVSSVIEQLSSTGEIDGATFAECLIKNQENYFPDYTLWYLMENQPGTTYLIRQWQKTKDYNILNILFTGFNINFLGLDLEQEDFEGLFAYFSSLNTIDTVEFLHLSFNNIKYLPKEIYKFQNLKELSLSQNQLRELPEEIGYLSKLESLLIDGNKLQQLPKNIGQLQNLKSLFIDENNFKSLPSEINNLKKLTNLYLGDNQLEILPEWIVELQNLEVLSVSNNKLSFLPDTIGQLQFKGLTSYLSLNDNQLKELPNSFQQLTQLKTLYIRNNLLSDEKIQQLKEWLPNCEIIFS